MTPEYAMRPPPGFRGHPQAPRGGMGVPRGGMGPPRGGMGMRGGRRAPPPGVMRGHQEDFEKPQRPGYYAGNRQFRMDKMRGEPLEKLHSRANEHIERERQERLRKAGGQRK